MTKIAVVADSHFSERNRFEECCRLHDWIAQDLAARGVDLVCHSGDLYDARSTPAERRAAADWLRQVAEIAPVVIVRGNHDALGDLPLLSRLRTRHPIIVEEAAAVHLVAGVAVACLAWPRKSELLARIGAASQEESSQIASEALRSVLIGLGDELSQHDGPRVLLSHAMVSGSITSTGQPLIGCDMELGLQDLALARAHFVALGHIHKAQDWQFGGVPIVYPGSPRRTAFGELECKGYVVADIGGDGAVDWEFVEAPATPMVLVEDEWGVDPVDGQDGWLVGCHGLGQEQERGAEIRFRYRVASDKRDAARRAAEELRRELLANGAIRVQIEEVVQAQTRARAPEIAQARTLGEKLAAFWAAKGLDLGERQGRVLGRLNQLEAEVTL